MILYSTLAALRTTGSSSAQTVSTSPRKQHDEGGDMSVAWWVGGRGGVYMCESMLNTVNTN